MPQSSVYPASPIRLSWRAQEVSAPAVVEVEATVEAVAVAAAVAVALLTVVTTAAAAAAAAAAAHGGGGVVELTVVENMLQFCPIGYRSVLSVGFRILISGRTATC